MYPAFPVSIGGIGALGLVVSKLDKGFNAFFDDVIVKVRSSPANNAHSPIQCCQLKIRDSQSCASPNVVAEAAAEKNVIAVICLLM